MSSFRLVAPQPAVFLHSRTVFSTEIVEGEHLLTSDAFQVYCHCICVSELSHLEDRCLHVLTSREEDIPQKVVLHF